jgi:phage tail-like protein
MPKPALRQRFVVEIEGVRSGTFSVLENFTGEVEVLEYKDGDDATVRKRPGRTKFGDITLKKGTVESSALWDWWQGVSTGKLERKQVTIILLDSKGQERLRWILAGCWPCRWHFSADQSDEAGGMMFEEITFVIERAELVRKPRPVRKRARS